MANHVYFNISINGLSEEQHDTMFKSEVNNRPHWKEGEDPIEFRELVDRIVTNSLNNKTTYIYDKF